MPKGVAINTEPVMANSVPHNIGVRLYNPSAGCQEGSVKNRSRPTCWRAGSASTIKKTTMSMTMAPAMVAMPRKLQHRSSSVDQRDKVLLLNDVMYGFRLCVLDKGFGQSNRRSPSDDV